MRKLFSVAVVAIFVVLAAAANPASAASKPPSSSRRGYDISWPQCGGAYPRNPSFGIVGVNHGRPWDHNGCLASEYVWAAAAPVPAAFYANSANPGTLSIRWTYAGPRSCSGSGDDLGCAYNYGWNAAGDAFSYAQSQTGAAASQSWWIDVETANTWAKDTASNVEVLRGMRDFLDGHAARVGFYSTTYQWGVITGGTSAFASHPSWVAGASNAKDAVSRCAPAYSFTGGAVALVQYPSGSYDADYAC